MINKGFGKILFYYLSTVLLIINISSCSNTKQILHMPFPPADAISGDDFFKEVVSYKWQQRDSVAVAEILSGNIPSFLKKFVPIISQITHSAGKRHRAIIYVAPDYLSIGKNDNFARIPLTSMAAQKIADSLHCFLPTRKIVDLIYQQAKINLAPVPATILLTLTGYP